MNILQPYILTKKRINMKKKYKVFTELLVLSVFFYIIIFELFDYRATLLNMYLNLYPLFGFLKQFISAYIAVLVFIAASIILENAYRKGDV